MRRAARPGTWLALVCAGLLGCAGLTPSTSASGTGADAQATAADPELLPPELRERGARLLALRDPADRAREVRALARAGGHAALPFLARVAASDPHRGVRYRAIRGLAHGPLAQVARALEHSVERDPDPELAVIAADLLLRARARDLHDRLGPRAAAATDPEARARLADAHDRLAVVANGGALPGFLRRAPPLFAVPGTQDAARRDALRVLVFGDFGNGRESQRGTAEAMAREHATRPFDFGVTVGDNFYPKGVASPADPKWRTVWRDSYAGLGIPIYATLGNHDWARPDSPAAQVLYAVPGSHWHMPAACYTFRAGPAQFFALDTTAWSRAQADWLDAALDASEARWKIVFGHHPIRSAGRHGDSPRFVAELLPLLADRARLYLAGHDHDLQHLGPERGVHMIVSGGGGASPRPLGAHAQARFGHSGHGFAVLEISDDTLAVRLIDRDGGELYAAELD